MRGFVRSFSKGPVRVSFTRTGLPRFTFTVDLDRDGFFVSLEVPYVAGSLYIGRME